MTKEEMNNLVAKINSLFAKKGIHPKNKKDKINEVFYKSFTNAIITSQIEHGDADQLIDFLQNNDNLSIDLNSNFRKQFLDFDPFLKQNKTWKSIVPYLTKIVTKGKGTGEMLLTLILPMSKSSSSNDLICNGTRIECKKFDGGCLKGNKDTNFRIIDQITKKYGLKTKDKKSLDVYNQINEMSWENRSAFFNELYPHAEQKEIEDLVNNIKDSNNAAYHHGIFVFKLYQKYDGFETLLLISEGEETEIICVSDLEDISFLKENIEFRPKFYRGKDTMAMGDGYVVIKGKKVK